MADVELIRTPGDRRRLELEGIGTLRLERLSRATAEAGGVAWQFDHRFWKAVAEATDLAGGLAGKYVGGRRDGTLRWGEREFTLRQASFLRYALADGERELVLLDWGTPRVSDVWRKRPAKITVEDPAALEPGLLLFASYVVCHRVMYAAMALGRAASGA